VIWAVLPVTVLASAGLFCCCAVRITVTQHGGMSRKVYEDITGLSLGS